MIPLVKFGLASSAAFMTNKRNVFGVDINPLYSFMVSEIFSRPTYFSYELTYLKLSLLCVKWNNAWKADTL